MNLSDIRSKSAKQINSARTAQELESARVEYLGRKGAITSILRGLKDMPLGERKKIGPEAQKLKREIEELFKKKLVDFASGKESEKNRVDITVPGKRVISGHLHPLTLVERQIRKIFSSMAFSVIEGPELETEYYNFDALNLPKDHPAREMWDTFWVKKGTRNDEQKNADDKLLLRTHTSPVQIRYMEKHTPPFQIIVPGRVSRYEATDMTHEVHFLNLEGLMVGKDVTLANFKFVIEMFFRKFFGKDIEFRYRPSYFPFVEPGVEVDIKFKSKWLEVMGAGMVHPRVFGYAHYNPRDWRGFAFGIGVERLAMIKYNIPDIRLFYSGELRFIQQF